MPSTTGSGSHVLPAREEKELEELEELEEEEEEEAVCSRLHDWRFSEVRLVQPPMPPGRPGTMRAYHHVCVCVWCVVCVCGGYAP